MKKIAIFISGAGSNAERMILRFSKNENIEVSCLISSKQNEHIENLCKQHEVSYTESPFREENHQEIMSELMKKEVEWIVLAGFLKKIPEEIIQVFPDRIINLHPSLLPKFPGLNTHKKAIESKEKYHGASVHFVTEELDGGPLVSQEIVKIDCNETEISLAKKVLEREHILYPKVIHWYTQDRLTLVNKNTATLDGKTL